jgi:adenosylcobyric acid synthase
MGNALMVQGTASHVGKSVLVAGLCRLYKQEGLRVAPFKAQNMALNSFATVDGGEIGRAQAAQAEAAGTAPTVDMNPILLKPEGKARSQVVVAGRVHGVMDAAAYHASRHELWPIVEGSLRRLLDQYDVVVIEGAGSPVEVNLKESDLVNMRVARAVSAPVLLVADIDRGGVFASLVGTMELLDREERELVAGFIVNKFRGDLDLFRPGIAFLEQRLGRPVLGVVPWLEEIGIAEEDSQGLPTSETTATPDGSWVEVAVIRLPHIANFDDFDPLVRRPGVRLRYVDRPGLLGEPDLLIIPGTKMTRADLAFLRERNLDDAIGAHAHRGGAILGICGGYQMLGSRIDDQEGIEGSRGVSPGLGLLDAVTEYAREKATIQVRGRVRTPVGLLSCVSGAALEAYEIHMGRTTTHSQAPFDVQAADGSWVVDGALSDDGRVMGTYLHGLFANNQLREGLLAALAARKGIVLPPREAAIDPYNRLAATLRRCLDLDYLRSLIAAQRGEIQGPG